MKGYADNIETVTQKNSFFRKVLYTGKHTQLVAMCLQSGEEIGLETHEGLDQFFRFESGEGKVVIDGEDHLVKDGYAVIVPGGSAHNIMNTGSTPLKLYTLYSPPNHPDGTIHKTKAEAIESEKKHHG